MKYYIVIDFESKMIMKYFERYGPALNFIGDRGMDIAFATSTDITDGPRLTLLYVERDNDV